jgi:hypothetical protein
MPPKLQHADVARMIADEGCVLLNTRTYTTSKSDLEIQCGCDGKGIFVTSWTQFKNRHIRCSLCRAERCKETMMRNSGVTHASQLPRHAAAPTNDVVSDAYEHTRAIFAKAGCVLLTEVIHSSAQKLRFSCSCPAAGTHECTLGNFVQGTRCSACRGTRVGKLSTADVRAKYEAAGCVLLEDAYTNAVTKMRFTCVCGGEGCNTYADFAKGKRCNDRQCQNKRIAATMAAKLAAKLAAATTD